MKRLTLTIVLLMASATDARADTIRDFRWEETLDPRIVEGEMALRIRRAPAEAGDFDLRIHICMLGYVSWRLETADAARRLKLAEIVVRYAKEAVALNSNHAAGHHWVAVGVAMAGVSRGILNSLQLIPIVRQSFERSAAIDPHYLWASAYSQLGRMYAVLPGFPVSIGDKMKAAEYFAMARRIAPDETLPLLYAADLYWASDQPEKALEIIAQMKTMKPANAFQFFSYTMNMRKAEEMRGLIMAGKPRDPLYDVTNDFAIAIVH